MRQEFRDKYITLNKWEDSDRYTYFLIFALNKKYSIRNAKRVFRVAKVLIEKDILYRWSIETLINRVQNKKYLWAILTICKEKIIDNIHDINVQYCPMWFKLKLQERLCVSHHAYKNNYYNSLLGLELEEPVEGGD
jgi:hypothetical protein